MTKEPVDNRREYRARPYRKDDNTVVWFLEWRWPSTKIWWGFWTDPSYWDAIPLGTLGYSYECYPTAERAAEAAPEVARKWDEYCDARKPLSPVFLGKLP